MRKTIISWLINASVAAFAIGALEIPFKGVHVEQFPALVFSALAILIAIILSKEK